MATLKDKTLFITAASRGIGKAIALRAARDGARIVIVAKTERPHDRLPGTIYTGHFFIDEDVMHPEGVTDLRHYQVDPQKDDGDLLPDFFL